MLTGIDVGGTRIKGGLDSPEGEIVHEATLWLHENDRTEEGMVKRVAELVRSLGPSDGVGLGIAGIIHQGDQRITSAPNFPLWNNFCVGEQVARLVDRPVVIDNDANCVIRGEHIAGVARGETHVIGITLGTGVGGAIILNDRVWMGVEGMAGEYGHSVVDPHGAPCGCGGTGCLETFTSAVGLRRLCTLNRPVGLSADELASADFPRLLAQCADDGDPIALEHFTKAGWALGITLAGLLNTLNIKVVVLAGGVAAAFHHMREATWQEIHSRAFTEVAQGVSIRIGELGERAGIIGAAFACSKNDANRLTEVP